ncbi:DUF3667 domain-containing protein [Hirschia baltica]|uniref:DUF3667 domain-containing protein n=1 Tax=Hirschia baltica (strain ATCC 49814 / DSM 5838 / IFAM 1418) TaxID=582402 RepID=C6XJ11_HIRBI|nr:DUF3667 domain-containing protein [Hirschia baltica]ACT59106.1 hypothetical protein Hbal_1415 [Hirschia baltica ATCC 49814]
MSSEIEAGGLWGLARSLRAGKKNKPKFTNCQNCKTALTGRYCHECGQLADDFQRPIWSLVAEGVSDFLSLDGRLWRTLPQLLLRPGRITRHYIDGKRASHVPPFRLYLVASLLFFTTFFVVGASGDDVENLFNLAPNAAKACEEARAEIKEDPEAAAKWEEICENPEAIESKELSVDDLNFGEGMEAYSQLVTENINILLKEPQRFWLLVQNWAPRIAFLLLPFMVIGLGVLYPFKRGVYLYDHVVLSLHFLTMLFILMTVSFVLPKFLSEIFVFVLIFYPFIYLYRTLRVVFDSGRITSFLRAFIMWCGSFIVTIFLVVVTIATVTITA